MPPGPKQSGSVRQKAPSSLSKVSTPPTTSSPKVNKASKSSLVIHLSLSSEILLRFPHASPSQLDGKQSLPPGTSKTSSKNSSTPSAPVKSESDASQSARGPEDSQPSDYKLKDGDTTVKAGVKGELNASITSDDKAKPKPIQRKRPKVGENGRLDGRTAAAKAMGYNAAAHKLGPKANQGVINEKLRALDRTPKPCRKWQKTGFKIKSFTGRIWEVPTWRTPQTRCFGEEAESREGSSNDISKENSSSNVGSDKSPAGENPTVASSPIPIAPASS